MVLMFCTLEEVYLGYYYYYYYYYYVGDPLTHFDSLAAGSAGVLSSTLSCVSFGVFFSKFMNERFHGFRPIVV